VSLERKDVRAKLDPDMHEALTALCEAEEIDLGVFVERELVRVIKQRVHAATVIVERLARRGKAGSGRE
jgi:hypothetical protein